MPPGPSRRAQAARNVRAYHQSPDVPVRTVFTFRQGLAADQPPPLFTPEPVPNRAKRGGKQRPLAGQSVVLEECCNLGPGLDQTTVMHPLE
ncbi:hypothetical protein HYQ44_003357 [Verticillium longisporum]|nr:hypothetical protein HYQ44_003357 [Verticillium longisporum]